MQEFKPLTAQQLNILATIAHKMEAHGFPPTVREIGESVGLASPSSVKYHLDLIEKQGYILRDPHRSRTIEITEQGQQTLKDAGIKHSNTPKNNQSAAIQFTVVPTSSTDDDLVSVPLVGTIAAGVPITATETEHTTFSLPRELTGKGELFMLKVQGESMIDAAICDGDWVVIRKQPNAENGEIVAAMIDGEATVKVWQRRDDHCWLLPRNSEFAPILGDEAQILGKVVSVLRAL